VTATEVRPPNVALEPPKEIVVVPIVPISIYLYIQTLRSEMTTVNPDAEISVNDILNHQSNLVTKK
jgi:hypothetical protein